MTLLAVKAGTAASKGIVMTIGKGFEKSVGYQGSETKRKQLIKCLHRMIDLLTKYSSFF